ncbi:enoyl-CoA hydratase [Aestuariivirga litoralis]|uniref:enoyl-CoA hydratase n=1 Tax=Aestuariivirga litoralis TaxID=2650924 RepID=A0A2W2CBC0_9HYPH|nr:enoyl-CoA hydratase [Aestuariivirga litoralis]PZF77483.1 enoyl-CoA hydratase [Aestuariivirga litoralis]
MAFQNIIVETRGKVGLVTLNRPQALNALNEALIAELNEALTSFESNPGVGCAVLTGSEKAFAAGADVKEMAEKGYIESYLGKFLDGWTRVAETRKPVIAAVSGFCLGGGLELAMMCDLIIASETARFALPEITLGIMPGAGGTQRLPRFIGKAKAMDLILTGRMMDATEGERCGLVARVVTADKLLDEALTAAAKIAGYSQPIVMMAKETVNRAQEMSLSEGVRFERRLFLSMFATEDQKEGMQAFIEKRKPRFQDR